MLEIDYELAAHDYSPVVLYYLLSPQLVSSIFQGLDFFGSNPKKLPYFKIKTFNFFQAVSVPEPKERALLPFHISEKRS